MKQILITLALIATIFIVACSPISSETHSTAPNEPSEPVEVILDEIQTTSDGTKYLVNPNKILGGGPPKDGIPSIDEPIYQPLAIADNWIEDNELVLAIDYKGVKRVYPLQILVWHEIVNDVIAGDPILITYCPLCGSGIAYERTINIDGKTTTTEFGTSGKLFTQLG